MNIFIIVLASLILGAIVLAIGVRHELEKAPGIKLIQGKLNDEDCNEIQEAVQHLKIVNEMEVKQWKKNYKLSNSEFIFERIRVLKDSYFFICDFITFYFLIK